MWEECRQAIQGVICEHTRIRGRRDCQELMLWIQRILASDTWRSLLGLISGPIPRYESVHVPNCWIHVDTSIPNEADVWILKHEILGKRPCVFRLIKPSNLGAGFGPMSRYSTYIYIYMYIVHSSTMYMWCWLIASILDSDVMQRTSCCSNCHAADSVFDHEKSRGGCWMCHLYPFVSYEFGSVGFIAEINQAIALLTIESFYCRSSQCL